MKRSNDSDDEEDDPSVPPADGTSPIDLLPQDMFYQILMAPGQSIRDIARLCRVDRRFRAACTMEYVWRKLYFLKVVKSPGLAAMKEPEAVRHINSELMYTPEGVQWTAQLGFAQTPYVLLMAFAWLDMLLGESKEVRTPYGEPMGIFFVNDTNNQASEIYVKLQYINGRLGLFASSLTPELLTNNGLQIIFPSDQASIHLSLIPYTRYVSFLCRLIQAGFHPNQRHNYTLPRTMVESCLSCGSPTASFQCGAECGQARYCDQECANTHWEEHRKECSSKH